MAAPRKTAAKDSAPTAVGKRELRAFLETCSRETLINQVLDLFTSFEQVRDYYHVRVRGEDQESRDRYKARIRAEFAWRGNTPPRMRLSDAKRAVSDYRKVAASVEGMADMLFYYVEMALTPVEEIDFQEEHLLVNSILGMYRDAIVHVRKHGLDREFVDRSYEIVQRGARQGYGPEFQEIHDLACGLPDPP